jgi:hypothetical protein
MGSFVMVNIMTIAAFAVIIAKFALLSDKHFNDFHQVRAISGATKVSLVLLSDCFFSGFPPNVLDSRTDCDHIHDWPIRSGTHLRQDVVSRANLHSVVGQGPLVAWPNHWHLRPGNHGE